MELGYDVLILDDTSSFLTPRLVDRLQRADRAVIGVYDPERGGPGQARLLEMGVDAVIVASASPEELVEAIEEVVERRDLVQRFAEVLGPDLTTEAIPQPTTPAPAGGGSWRVRAADSGNRCQRGSRGRGGAWHPSGRLAAADAAWPISTHWSRRWRSVSMSN